jgi:peptidoglycan/xylan/chitin deacetylase (PgdA/CDA1 family)/signal transduction histidine kinase
LTVERSHDADPDARQQDLGSRLRVPPLQFPAPAPIEDRRRGERRRAERAHLEEMVRSIRSVAHDINNMLWVIENQIELLESGDARGDQHRLAALHRAVAHCEALTDTLLGVGRPAAASTVVDVNKVIDELTPLLEQRSRSGIVVECQLRATTPRAAIPRADLERVLLNLVTNACEAMPTGGRITITTENDLPPDATDRSRASSETRDDPPFVAIRISDTGPGLADSATERAPEVEGRRHHGLGLATSHQLTLDSGGRIDVETVRGVGTSFTIWLPTVLADGRTVASMSDADGGADRVGPTREPPRRAYWRIRNRLPVTYRTVVRRSVDTLAGPLVGSVAGVKQNGEGAAATVGLTFDDGPDPLVTPRLLALLDAAQVRATFFVLVDAAEAAPDLVRRMLDEGHEVGLHGADHRRLTSLPRDEIAAHLVDGRDRLTRITGVVPRLFRPPFGSQSLWSYFAARRLGLTPVVWTADAEDWYEDDADAVERRALSRVEPGGILLLHERARPEPGAPPLALSFDPVAVVGGVVDGLRRRGLEPTSVGALAETGPLRRTVWFRP